jgi:type II secretory pathway pseudopilin PulG
MRTTARPGFSLIEVALAISAGLAVVSASVFAYTQIAASARLDNAQMMVGTIKTNIQMDKFRLGTPPPAAATPSPYASSFGINLNTDSVGRPYFPNASPGAMPVDPVTLNNAVLPYDSTASPVPLAAGAPTPQWDNPVFLSPGPSPGYGKGGWLYDANTGSFRANLSNQAYPAERPGQW